MLEAKLKAHDSTRTLAVGLMLDLTLANFASNLGQHETRIRETSAPSRISQDREQASRAGRNAEGLPLPLSHSINH